MGHFIHYLSLKGYGSGLNLCNKTNPFLPPINPIFIFYKITQSFWPPYCLQGLGRWKSITGNAFADDGGDPSKRNAAWVPSNPIINELIDKCECGGAKSSVRLNFWEAGEGQGDGLSVTWEWEWAANAASSSCIVFLTGLLRLTIGVLLPDVPSDVPIILAVIWLQSIGHVPVFLNPFLIFSGVKLSQMGPELHQGTQLCWFCQGCAGLAPPWLLGRTS